MFSFIHAADVHLDSPLQGLSRYDEAPADAIRGATRRAFERLVDLAVEEHVAFVLLAGDLLDGEWRDHQTGIFLNKQFGILERNNIRVFVVAGNHDANSRISKALQPPKNVRYMSTKRPESTLLDDLGVVVHGQGFKTQKTEDNLAREFSKAEPGKFNIGLLHTSLNGREGHDTYAPCSLDDLKSKGYDYWALGHVHEREVV
jgi:DNA repair exonuclease SbcCD nuclease subunit